MAGSESEAVKARQALSSSCRRNSATEQASGADHLKPKRLNAATVFMPLDVDQSEGANRPRVAFGGRGLGFWNTVCKAQRGIVQLIELSFQAMLR